MLRASLPKPNRMGLAKRAGTLAHSRIQSHKTSHQMLHPGTAQVTGQGRCTAQQRPLGKLERMDMLARQQVGIQHV